MMGLSTSQMKRGLIGAATATMLSCALFVAFDPTSKDTKALQGLKDRVARLPNPSQSPMSTARNLDINALTQAPIFVMTTGAMAYKEKTLVIYGISISPNRRAVLVSIDGAPASWMSVGEFNADLRLSEVGRDSARFETPVGMRTIGLNDPVSSANPNNTTQSPNLATGGQ